VQIFAHKLLSGIRTRFFEKQSDPDNKESVGSQAAVQVKKECRKPEGKQEPKRPE
jgi:hypothetical protein